VETVPIESWYVLQPGLHAVHAIGVKKTVGDLQVLGRGDMYPFACWCGYYAALPSELPSHREIHEYCYLDSVRCFDLGALHGPEPL
jgi:hypothetical protein